MRAQYTRVSSNFDEASLDGLIARAREQSSLQRDRTSVIYEACLVADALDTIYIPGCDENKKDKHVGVLGYQDKANALACLHQTPLLESFEAWSEWSKVFEPMFGNLKLFLRDHSHDSNPTKVNSKFSPRDLVAIETSSGYLLRITRVTSTDVFLECAKRGDVIGTSGHLVSLVFLYGGVKKAPLALLSSHMKVAYMSLNAESKEGEDSIRNVVRFGIKCLSRIPQLVCYVLAIKVRMALLHINFSCILNKFI